MEYRINQQERGALQGLPYIVRLTYLVALRPYMDYSTGIVGIKRGVSYQSLREELYVEPQRGDAGGSPSRQQMRRAVKALERAGLITIQSVGKRLILQCELATWDFSNQNLPDTKPTYQPDSNPPYQHSHFSLGYENIDREAARVQNALPDIPPETGLNIICFSKQFEKFWSIYPNKQSKLRAWEVFQAMSPSNELVEHILQAVGDQLAYFKRMRAKGYWLPNWRHPENWLIKRCWENNPFLACRNADTAEFFN